MEYFKLFLSDYSSSADELNSQIDNGVAFIDRARAANSSVLVHCVAGISRSSTIVIAYLMKREKMTLKDAYAYVKSKRTIIRPNQGFLKCLMKRTSKHFLKYHICGENVFRDAAPDLFRASQLARIV